MGECWNYIAPYLADVSPVVVSVITWFLIRKIVRGVFKLVICLLVGAVIAALVYGLPLL